MVHPPTGYRANLRGHMARNTGIPWLPGGTMHNGALGNVSFRLYRDLTFTLSITGATGSAFVHTLT